MQKNTLSKKVDGSPWIHPNTIFRKNSTDSKHFVYDRQAAKNAHKLDLTQHDIDRLEQLDKLLGTYSRSTASADSHGSSSQSSGSIGFKGFSLSDSGSKASQSQSQQSEDLHTVNDTMHGKKIDKDHLNVTKIEVHNDTQYTLSRDDVEAYLSELSNHVHLEGELILPKPIDAHLIKLSTLRAETKLLSHSVLVRTRSNVHVLPLRCPPMETRRAANNITNQYRWLVDKVDLLTETVENLTNQLAESKKQLSERVTQIENWTSKTDEFNTQMTEFRKITGDQQKQVSSQIPTLSQLENQIKELQRMTSQQHSELVNRVATLAGKVLATANAGKY